MAWHGLLLGLGGVALALDVLRKARLEGPHGRRKLVVLANLQVSVVGTRVGFTDAPSERAGGVRGERMVSGW